MNTTTDHPDFTALALGEHILGAPSQAVTDALRTSVSARQEAEQIRLTSRRLSLVLKGQRVTRLDAARRNAILHADPAAVRARFAAEEAATGPVLLPAPAVPRRRRSWMVPASAAAVLALAGAAVAMFLTRNPSQPETAKSQDDARPSGLVNISVADTASPSRPQVPAPPVATVPPIVKSPALHALPPMMISPPPPAQETIARQPAPAIPPKPEAAPAPPAARAPIPDFATPEKHRPRGK